MTPPPDPVAALRDVFWSDEAEAPNDPAEMYRRLHAAGWTLSRRSEQEALVAALEAVWKQLHTYHACPPTEHDQERCHWECSLRSCRQARAAIEGRP